MSAGSSSSHERERHAMTGGERAMRGYAPVYQHQIHNNATASTEQIDAIFESPPLHIYCKETEANPVIFDCAAGDKTE